MKLPAMLPALRTRRLATRVRCFAACVNPDVEYDWGPTAVFSTEMQLSMVTEAPNVTPVAGDCVMTRRSGMLMMLRTTFGTAPGN